MKWKNFALLCFFGLFCGFCFGVADSMAKNGDTVFFDKNIMVFSNDNFCKDNDICDLKEFKVTTQKFMVMVEGGENYGTFVKAEYETNSIESLKNYGFVMFIRGGW